MNKGIKKFLELSSIERKGVIVLIAVILIILGIQIYMSINTPDNNPKNLISGGNAELINVKFKQKSIESNIFIKPQVPVNQLFKFDPNTITIEEMRKLGMNNVVIKSLTNYRLKGGIFYKKEDIKKIYGLSTGFYESLLPYVIINRKENNKEQYLIEAEKGNFSVYDINMVDTTELQLLNGIGRVLAARIIKYRNLLGGYYNIDQLKEVYGLTNDKVSIIKKKYSADTVNIIKINLNQASERELERHPYIGKFVAKAIIDYRTKVVKIKSINEIFKNGIIPGNEFEKLKKYLVI